MNSIRPTILIAGLIWTLTSLSCSISLEGLPKRSSELRVDIERNRIIRTLEEYRTLPTSEGLQQILRRSILSRDIRLYPLPYRRVLTESELLTPLYTWTQTPINPPTLSGPTRTGTVGNTIKIKPDH